jgi:hypothetical protein
MDCDSESRNRGRTFLTSLSVTVVYLIVIISAFVVRPQISTWFIFSTFSGHDGICFFAVSLDPLAHTTSIEKHRYLRIAYPLVAALSARGMDSAIPFGWITPRVRMQGIGFVPRFDLFCAISLVCLNLVFVGLAAASLCRWLEPRCSRPHFYTFLLLVPNFVVVSSIPRCLTEPLVLLAVFRLQLAWSKSTWSAEVILWLIIAPFIKEYLLVLPFAWGFVRFITPGDSDPDGLRGFNGAMLREPRRWTRAMIAVLLVLPYVVYWATLADRFGVSFVGLKGGHASSNVSIPLVGFGTGIWELVNEPSNLVKSVPQLVMDMGYRILHLCFYLILLIVFFVDTPRVFFRGFWPRWQIVVHVMLMCLCLSFSSKVTHSAGDLGRVMSASSAFWTVAALRLDCFWWRFVWILVGCGLFVAQWMRLLVITRAGGFEIEESLKMIGLS